MIDVRTLFANALEMQTAADRKLYLDTACGNDPRLRQQVEELLRSHDSAQGFLDPEAFGWDARPDLTDSDGDPPAIVDRYSLLEKIGEGGMAVVYAAQQERPLRRKVALKIIKLGMDTKSVIARFEAERQALALMDHPSIARVFDAGTTETGRPYFVMELVEGTSITKFCDDNRLSIRDRLKMFVCVCQAIHHAHQKGIIHRDIKPSNVMVSLQDGLPVPKVIDFGIAKAMNRRLTETTLFTHYSQIIGTPEYMSPEQAELSDLEIDTRTDVYSLGALLYELLAGRPPFEAACLRDKSYAEIQRIVREQEPVRPSARIDTPGEELIEIARRRRTNPEALRRLIRTDLDWIVMKTLEKDRNRRYDSVSELAADVQRHLDHEPVLAGPPSTLYYIKKYIRRHRARVTTVGAVGVTLLIGLCVSAYLLGRVKLAMNTVTNLESRIVVDQCLSTCQRLYAQGSYRAALVEMEPLLGKTAVDPNIRLLHAQLLFGLGRPDESEAELGGLLAEEPQIAGAAHCLLSQIKQQTDPAQAQWHLEQTDRLMPMTADACYLRARTAETPEQALAWLDKALQRDPRHYASRESLALIHAGLRDYVKMQRDAEVLVVLRPKDYMGYALRALAQREMGDLERALPDHARAIELCNVQSELPILLDQRQETHWRLGDYEAALADARACVSLLPKHNLYRATLAKILFALKRYDALRDELDVLCRRGEDRFWFVEMTHYISDRMIAGESVELPESLMPEWPASWASPSIYLPTIVGVYHALLPKAERLVQGSYGSSSWSPDGQQLAYSSSEEWRWDNKARGLVRPNRRLGHRGIEILDLKSGRARVLVTSGGSPAWSPDGRFIAYEHAGQYYWYGEKLEIRLVPASGGTPRILAEGEFPHWARNSTRLYYRSAEDQTLRCIDVSDPQSECRRPIPCPDGHVKISPDERYMAGVFMGVLTVVELTSGKKVASWVVPSHSPDGFIRWSPDSAKISISVEGLPLWPSGLWIFDMEHKRGRHVLDPMALSCNWSPDGSHVALDLGYPQNEIWLTEIDPNVPVWEALSTGGTRGECLRRTWHQHIGYYQLPGANPFFTELFRRNLRALGISQFESGQYEDSLWTMEHVDQVPCSLETLCTAEAMAYAVMALAKLGRTEEAQQKLNELRRLFTERSSTAENYLAKAEKAVTADNGGLNPIWDHIQADRLDAALTSLENRVAANSTPAALEKEGLRSLRGALARAYWRSARTARHRNLGPREEIADYEKALRTDPNHVPALRDLALQRALNADPRWCDGAEAVRLAGRACILSDYQDSGCLAALAVAYAECGDFEKAAEWQQAALDQLPEDWSDQELIARSELYKQNQHSHVERVKPLVIWWPFADSDKSRIQDASGNGLNAVLKGNARIVVDPDRGDVLALDGQGSWIACEPDRRLNLTTEITISTWIRVKSFAKRLRFIHGKEGSWISARWVSRQTVRFSVAVPDVRAGGWGFLTGNRSVEDGKWHHLVGIYDGTHMYQYVDGELDDSALAVGHIETSNEPIRIGDDSTMPAKNDIWFDDFRIYSYALSQDQIKALYEGRSLSQQLE